MYHPRLDPLDVRMLGGSRPSSSWLLESSFLDVDSMCLQYPTLSMEPATAEINDEGF